jgi:glycosyltransferase involved in cell wall biosynthesis
MEDEWSNSRMKKTLAVAAICFPPVLIGPAVLMGNLFRHFPKGSYHVLMGRLDHVRQPRDADSMLQAQYTFTRFPFCHSQGNACRHLYAFLRDIFAVLEVTWKGLWIIYREKIDTIFVVADHYVEVAALLMRCLTGKKVILWLPDLYYQSDYDYKSHVDKFIRRILEPFVLKSADSVLVTGEPTQEYYKKKYNVTAKILRHSVELGEYNLLTKRPSKKDETTIVFTGIVTQSQLGSILDMVNIVNGSFDSNVKFIVVSTTDHHQLKQMGIEGKRVFCRQAKRMEIPKIQQSADILFLPLSFKYYSELNAITAAPSKLPEYLAAGRPILVYAPAHSYYVKYAREHKFALIVDKPDIDLLKQGLLRLKSDEALCQQLLNNARIVAMEHHNAEKVSSRLQYLLGITEKNVH